LRHALDDGFHQRWQQIRCDGVNNAETERADQRIFILFRDFLDGGGLFQHAFCLRDDLCAQRGHRNFAATAFEQGHAQLIFEFFDGDGKGGLRYEACFCCMAEMLFTGDGNYIFEFGKRHGGVWAFGSVPAYRAIE
jgi:hypothetical protein